ncbi:MAG: hypothetical protein H6867_02600 [Rhodospirillales bacterium]|nr:hypothetical protein [Rhodospirillales bacterium]MCB9997078.1 hypothetical protein [Rhodospirillales bacterium]
MAKTDPKKASSKKAPAAKKGKADAAPEKKNTKLRTVIVLVFGVIVMAGLLVMNAGNLAKIAVEKIGSDTLGTKVAIETLDVKLQEREVDVTGIGVDNPAGYRAPQAFKIEKVKIAADQIGQELLVFDEIVVSGTTINLEVKENKTNLTELHGKMDSGASTRKTAAEAPVKVIIRKLVIENATLVPAATLGEREMQPVTLPTVRILGIGESSGGMTASEAMTLITDRVITVAMRSAVEAQYLQGMDTESLKKIQGALDLPTGLIDQVKGLGDKVMKDLFGE